MAADPDLVLPVGLDLVLELTADPDPDLVLAAADPDRVLELAADPDLALPADPDRVLPVGLDLAFTADPGLDPDLALPVDRDLVLPVDLDLAAAERLGSTKSARVSLSCTGTAVRST